MCMCVGCGFVHMHTGAHGGQRKVSPGAGVMAAVLFVLSHASGPICEHLIDTTSVHVTIHQVVPVHPLHLTS